MALSDDDSAVHECNECHKSNLTVEYWAIYTAWLCIECAITTLETESYEDNKTA
jgi:ribosomal protein L37AE/L43A